MTPTEFRHQAEHRFGAHRLIGRCAMYLGIDLGTSELKVVLLDDGQRVVASAAEAITDVAAASALVRAGAGPMVGGAGLGDAAPARVAPGAARRRARDRADRPDARRRPARCRRQGAAAGDPVERRSKRTAMRDARVGAVAARGHRQRRDARASPHPSCCGSASTSRPSSLERRACCCRRIGCASGSPASTSARCPTPRARSGSTSAGASGPTSCSRCATSAARGCRAWSRAARSRAGFVRRSRRAGVSGSALAVAGGGGDNAASAVGVGAVRPRQGFVSLGTSGVCFLVAAKASARIPPLASMRSATHCRSAGTRCR